MRNIIILQNSNIPYDMDIAALYNPDKYNLYFVVDDINYFNLKERGDEKYFKDIIKISVFNIDAVIKIIKKILPKTTEELEFVAEAEECVFLCGELRKYFGISENNNERFVNKLIMKDKLCNSGIMLPKHMLFDKSLFCENADAYIKEIVDRYSFPFLVKPIDQASCVGVEKIRSINDFYRWGKSTALSYFEFEIDEFIEGTLYHCDSFIKNMKILYTQVSRCSRPCFDFIEGKSKGSIVLKPDSHDFIALTNWTESVLKHLNPPDNGVTHLEVFKRNNGDFVFLEIAYRAAGILIPDMYKKYLNVDVVTLHLLLQMDDTFNFSINNGLYSAWMAFPTKKGILDQIDFPRINSRHELRWYFQQGDILDHPKKGRDYAATILLWNDNYNELEKDFSYLNDFVPYTVRC
jgi:hypothetical protein